MGNTKNHVRKYSLNSNYFDKIDTEDKAYFLGLLYADGCNSKDFYKFHIALQEGDKDILEKFKTYLGYNGPLKLTDQFEENVKRQKQYRLTIGNKVICKKLNDLGCIPAKSLILKFPTEEQVPAHLIRHFIRGYFDGDGCLYFKLNHKLIVRITFCSSLDFCYSLKNILHQINFNSSIYIVNDSTKFSTLNILGNRDTQEEFLDWLYKDAIVYLERKYQKYLEFKRIKKDYVDPRKMKIIRSDGVIFESIRSAARTLGKNCMKEIRLNLKGDKPNAKGFTFKYAE